MSKKDKLEHFAQSLIRQKRIIRSMQYLLFVSFLSLSIGTVLSIPLRYYLSVSFKIPLLLLAGVLILTLIYGYLGIETPLSVLQEADSKLDLHEKLSAAYQFGETENPYSELILDDSLEIVASLKSSRVYQIRFSRRDPFQPLLLALFLYLWISSFSFLQIDDSWRAIGEILVDTSGKIDAVNSETKDRDLDDIAEEYRKLGQKIQDQFMNDQSIEDEVEELSGKLERKIEELSREGVNRESQTLSDGETESEVFQLNRKKEMSDDLNEILQNLMKTFSLSPYEIPGRSRSGEGGRPGEGDQKMTMNDNMITEESPESESSGDTSSENALVERSPEVESGDSSEFSESPDNTVDGETSSSSTDSREMEKNEEGTGEKSGPADSDDKGDELTGNSNPGNMTSEDFSDLDPLIEQEQSGEFDEENIRGELGEGEQMKSFIRALPHIVEPTLKEMEVIHFYRNQLETAVDTEILPESYQSVVRDYFLSIGVL
ncbi:MAG: hypothetical protein JEY91_05835, partial [Spirochaetaceae bacterium]|nr:hypothetical protein [Spirochaetaceae bacterium]